MRLSKEINTQFMLVVVSLGVIWLRSSYGKLAAGNFLETLGGTVIKFSSKNPYSWFKTFLDTFVLSNITLVGQLVIWGEFFAALATIGAAVFLLFGPRKRGLMVLLSAGLLIGGMLNILFWLAAGWTSSSTESLNLLMLAVEVIGLWYCLRLLAPIN